MAAKTTNKGMYKSRLMSACFYRTKSQTAKAGHHLPAQAAATT